MTELVSTVQSIKRQINPKLKIGGVFMTMANETNFRKDIVASVKVAYAASTSGNSVVREVTLDGSGSTTGSNVWYALPAARREAIGLILLYSNQMWDHSISVTTTKKDANPICPPANCNTVPHI